MKVAVLCEFSGVVRDAFIKKGHDVISCDILQRKNQALILKEIYLIMIGLDTI